MTTMYPVELVSPRRHTLKSLRIDEVSLCEAGASPGAVVVLAKSLDHEREKSMSAHEVIQAGAVAWRERDPRMTIEKARVEIRKARPDLADRERIEGWRPATQAEPLFKSGSASAEIDTKARALIAGHTGKLSLQHARIMVRGQYPDLAARERDEERAAA